MTFTDDIKAAVEVLKRGGVIAYPTDTVWGIGCDATNAEAVRRVFEIKRRADSKALISLVCDAEMLRRHVGDVPDEVCAMIAGSERPLTVVYSHGRGVAEELLAADGSMGVRLSTEKYSATLCRELGGPVVSTSANFSGEPSPALFGEIDPALLAMLDYVATYRRDDMHRSEPSRVVKAEPDGTIKILRP